MLKKQYLSDRKTCKVTFTIDHGAAREASRVALVGDFNAWSHTAHPMQRLRSGSFSTTVKLA